MGLDTMLTYFIVIPGWTQAAKTQHPPSLQSGILNSLLSIADHAKFAYIIAIRMAWEITSPPSRYHVV
jgi:hypothetical protein